MRQDVYNACLETSNFRAIVQEFYESLVDTNRGHKFYVDWDKVKRNVERYTIELNILNSLIGSKDFDNDLRYLLSRYPEVLPIIPLLIAVRVRRDPILQVVADFLDEEPDVVKYNFEKRELSSAEIEKFVDFFDKTGLKVFFEDLAQRSLLDYYAGVEVGMDTHARKNRSGKAMELVLEPILEQISERQGESFTVLSQKTFGYLNDRYGLEVNSSIANRKADFIIVKGKDIVINIEVNFFRGSGSKPQEIVDSYINRQSELRRHGFYFMWVTDGQGWKGQRSQIRKGFREIDYLFNLHFVRVGVLEYALANL
jgi:type II restriction enzyme